jgi:hypothetical protein
LSDVDLPQAEADALLAMPKERTQDGVVALPAPGGRLQIPLQSVNKREFFFLDLSRARIDLKGTYQNRARQVVVLRRLCFGRKAHTNPDGESIPSPHLHLYREGYGDRWAVALPTDAFDDSTDLRVMLQDFMKHCNITKPPAFQWGLIA